MILSLNNGCVVNLVDTKTKLMSSPELCGEIVFFVLSDKAHEARSAIHNFNTYIDVVVRKEKERERKGVNGIIRQHNE